MQLQHFRLRTATFNSSQDASIHEIFIMRLSTIAVLLVVCVAVLVVQCNGHRGHHGHSHHGNNNIRNCLELLEDIGFMVDANVYSTVDETYETGNVSSRLMA